MKALLALLLLVCQPALTLACDYQEVLSNANKASAAQRIFTAIRLIEVGVVNCYHPRLSLELGELYASLGQYKKAVSIWQASLVQDLLPDRVATKVKLRIIQMSVAQRKIWSNSLLLKAAAQTDFGTDVGRDLTAFGFSRLKGYERNFFGYALAPALTGQFSATNRYGLQSKVSDNFISLESSAILDLAWIETSIGARVQSINSTSVAYVAYDVRLGLDRLNTLTALSWRLDGLEWDLEQSVSTQRSNWRASININRLAKTVAGRQTARWEEASARIQLSNRFRPVMKVALLLPAEQVDIDMAIRYPFNASNWLTFKTAVEVSQTSQWASSLSYTWRLI